MKYKFLAPLAVAALCVATTANAWPLHSQSFSQPVQPRSYAQPRQSTVGMDCWFPRGGYREYGHASRHGYWSNWGKAQCYKYY